MHSQNIFVKPGSKNQNCTIVAAAVAATTFHEQPLHSIVFNTHINTDGDADYIREGEQADVLMTLVAGTIGQHVDFGWIELNAGAENGLYQFGIPDAAIDHGAKWVDFIFNFKTDQLGQMIHLHIDLQLLDR